MSAPYWPVMMKRATAAAYLDMSERAFLSEVAKGRLPESVAFGGRPHWRKDAIDAAIARLAGEADIPEYLREFEARYGNAA